MVKRVDIKSEWTQLKGDGMFLTRCDSVLCRVLVVVAVTLAVASSAAIAAGKLVINEVMINEPGSETALEWVELFNSGDDSLNLKNYLFIEAADTTRFVLRWIHARAFVVLARKPLSTDGTASFERQWGNGSNVWGDDTLESYPVLPAKMSLRNSNDSVTIVELATGLGETVKWETSPPDGVSLERINPNTEARGKNFKYCRSKTLSTPGAVNSVIAKNRDLGFIEDDCEIFVPPSAAEPVILRLAIANLGLLSAPPIAVTIVDDRNFDGKADQGDTVILSELPALAIDSTVTSDIEVPAKPGHRAFIVRLPEDDDSTNNRLEFECVIGPRAEELQIAEIMNNADLSHGGEWIEVAGVVNYDLSMRGWKLEIDGGETALDSISVIPAFSRAIICQDSSALRQAYHSLRCPVFQPTAWHTLGNGSGTIVMRMGLGAISDSVTYLGGEPARSWERDPDSTSQEFHSLFYLSTDSLGATPCAVNSPRPVPVGNDLGIVPGTLAIAHSSGNSNLVDISLQIVNHGYRDATPTQVEVAEDTDRDSLVDVGETIYSAFAPAVKSRDTVIVSMTLELTVGRHLLIVRLPEDEVAINNKAFACITSGSLSRELVITEFLADPEGPLESEWVEFKNASSFAVSLSGWSIGDLGRQSPLRSNTFLAPGEYRVVAQDSAAYVRYYGGSCIPISVANWSNLNNGGDGIVLRDEYGTISDSVVYLQGAGENRSLAKNEESTPGIPLWFASLPSSGPTPCSANDRPEPLPAHDLGLVASSVSLRKTVTDPTQVVCSLLVANNGYMDMEISLMGVFDDANLDHSGSAEEWLAELDVPALEPGDTAAITTLLHLKSGRHILIFQLADDEISGNNQVTALTSVGPLTHEFVFTEILADPESPVTTEWVEVFNRSAGSLSLNGWSLGDGVHQRLVASGSSVEPGAYAILAADSAAFVRAYGEGCSFGTLSSWPGLSNSGEVVVLRDEFGTVSDSVRYIAGAGGNRSLECVESDSTVPWYPSTAVGGATPCERNSVSNRYSGTFAFDLLNRVFAPAAGEQLRFTIQCPPATKLTIEVFDLEGRRLSKIADSQYFSSGEFAYDGRSDSFDRLPMGAYILRVESEDGSFARKLGFAVASPK